MHAEQKTIMLFAMLKAEWLDYYADGAIMLMNATKICSYWELLREKRNIRTQSYYRLLLYSDESIKWKRAVRL